MKTEERKFEKQTVRIEEIDLSVVRQVRDWKKNHGAIEDKIEEIVASINAGERIEEIKLCRSGEKYIATSGGIRLAAFARAKVAEISALVFDGTLADALFEASRQDRNEALSRNRADRTAALMALLRNEEVLSRFPSNVELASHCLVDESYVRKVRKKLGLKKPDQVQAKRQDGESYTLPTKNLGKRKGKQKQGASSSRSGPQSSSVPTLPNSQNAVEREPDIFDCGDLDEVIRKAGSVDLIVTDKPTREGMLELWTKATQLLGTNAVTVILTKKPIAERVPSIINAIVDECSTVLASKGYRGGVSGADCRYVGMTPDLAQRQSKPSVNEPLPPQRLNPDAEKKQEESTV